MFTSFRECKYGNFMRELYLVVIVYAYNHLMFFIPGSFIFVALKGFFHNHLSVSEHLTILRMCCVAGHGDIRCAPKIGRLGRKDYELKASMSYID